MEIKDEKTMKNLLNLNNVVSLSFTQKTWKRGDLFPILTTNDSSIFLSNSVNHGQGLMCLKFQPLFLYKQHPNGHYIDNKDSVKHTF